MSSLLEQAIVDAKALKEAAMKNAEATIIDKYSDEVKSTLNQLLEQDELAAALGMATEAPEAEETMEEEVAKDEIVEGVPDAFTEDVAELDGVAEGEESVVTIDFAELAEALKELREGMEEQELEEGSCSPGSRDEETLEEAEEEEPMEEELELDEASIVEMVASMLSERDTDPRRMPKKCSGNLETMSSEDKNDCIRAAMMAQGLQEEELYEYDAADLDRYYAQQNAQQGREEEERHLRARQALRKATGATADPREMERIYNQGRRYEEGMEAEELEEAQLSPECKEIHSEYKRAQQKLKNLLNLAGVTEDEVLMSQGGVFRDGSDQKAYEIISGYISDEYKKYREAGCHKIARLSETADLEEEIVEEGEEDLYEELSDDLLDAIMEKLTVDMGATLGGWAGRSEEAVKHQMELEMAHRRSTEVAEELEALKKAQEELVFENKKLKETLSNYQEVVGSLKENVQDVNLSNARLLYTNRTLRNTSLNERQKERIVEAISKAGSVEEAKTIHETLQSTVASTPKRGPKSLSEAITRPTSVIRASRKEEPKADPFTTRMRKLAGIN